MNHSFFFSYNERLHCGIVCEKKKITSLSEATLVAYSTNRVKIERHCETSSLHEKMS